MKDWSVNPTPADLPQAWERIDRYIESVDAFKSILKLPDGSDIVVDGPTSIPHGERRRIPRAAWLQPFGALVSADLTVTSIDSRYIHCDSSAAVPVHVLVLL